MSVSQKAIDSSWLKSHRQLPGSSPPRALESSPSSAFLGLKDLGAAAACGAEAFSTWVSANLAAPGALTDAAAAPQVNRYSKLVPTLLLRKRQTDTEEDRETETDRKKPSSQDSSASVAASWASLFRVASTSPSLSVSLYLSILVSLSQPLLCLSFCLCVRV